MSSWPWLARSFETRWPPSRNATHILQEVDTGAHATAVKVVARQSQHLARVAGVLAKPEVAEDREYDNYDADDVEDVVHVCSPFCPSSVCGGRARAYWT
jgi:hypothetical protein